MNKISILIIVFFISLSVALSQSVGLEIGNLAPEIKLPTPKGDTIALSSKKGKIVLIDFWASWCAPCVKEQPVLSALYQKYKNSKFSAGDGFDIYGVSFDNKKKQWQNIINKYKINWTQVSDLQFWTSPVAKDYNLQELPFNLLIDKNGIIITKNLHGDELENSLKKLLIEESK